MDADADAPAPAGRGLPPRPISPPHPDPDAPPRRAHGEAETGGIGQDGAPVPPVAHLEVGFHLGGAGRQVLGDDRDAEVLAAARFLGPRAGGGPAGGDVGLQVLPEQEEHAVDGADHVGERVAGDHQDAPPHGAPGEAETGGIGQDEAPVLPVVQRQVGFDLGHAGHGIYDRQRQIEGVQVLGNGRGGEVPEAARFAVQPPGGDPLQVLRERQAVGGAEHVGELVAEHPQGIEAGGDGITHDALPPIGRGGNGIGPANQGLGAGRDVLPPRGRGRGGEHPGAALPPRGRGRGGDRRPSPNVVDLHGPSANRPDAKGRTVPRLGRKFESKDDRTNAMNYQLQTLYRQLQERKADAREADETSGRKAALAIAKQYEKGLSKAEGLRREIARAQAVPVDKPKDLSKDPFA